MRSIKPSWRVSMPASSVFVSFLLLIQAISCCVISPSESVAIVGDRISFSCNARPNNQQRGSISYINLGSEGASGTEIFRPAKYNGRGEKTSNQSLADGYLLSHFDDIHNSKVTLEIKKTQLLHGGKYFCSCVDSTPTLGTANFIVLDKLSFVRNGDEVLDCSVSFNGSTSSAVIDLIISDANGTQVSSKTNLSLISNVKGDHAIQHKVIADPKEEQGFTCQMKVWNKSSTGESPLRSMTSSLNLEHQTTSNRPDTKSTAIQTTARTASIAVGVTAVVLVAALISYK